MRFALLVILALTGLLVPARAQETIEDKAAVCAACHGDVGKPQMPEVPNIWGQHAGYLYLQLKDFKSKSRASEIMGPIAAGLEKADMLALAEFFAAKPWPATGYSSDPSETPKGDSIGTAGMCTSCHLGTYFGDSAIPRLAGQTLPYLERTIIDFKTRKRNNNVDMSNLLQTFSDEDLKLMARFLAGL